MARICLVKAGHTSVNSRSNKMEKVRWSARCRERLGWAGCGFGCTLGTGFHAAKGFILSCGSRASCSLRAVVYQEAPFTSHAGLDRLGFVLQLRGFLQPQSSSVPGSPYATMWQVHSELCALGLLAVPQGRM